MDSTPTRLINIPGEILFFHNSKEELIIVRPVTYLLPQNQDDFIVIWNIYSEETARWSVVEYKDVFEKWNHRVQKRDVFFEKFKN